MTQDELKMVLEALELCNGAETVEGVVIYTDKAITALEEVLAEHAMREVQRLGQEIEHDYRTRYDRGCYKCGSHYCPADCPEPLHLVPQQPEQEPVIDKSAAIRIATTLGWTPPRAWVGLTDEEVSEVFGGDIHAEHSGELRFIRAIEAKLKEKNT